MVKRPDNGARLRHAIANHHRLIYDSRTYQTGRRVKPGTAHRTTNRRRVLNHDLTLQRVLNVGHRHNVITLRRTRTVHVTTDKRIKGRPNRTVRVLNIRRANNETARTRVTLSNPVNGIINALVTIRHMTYRLVQVVTNHDRTLAHHIRTHDLGVLIKLRQLITAHRTMRQHTLLRHRQMRQRVVQRHHRHTVRHTLPTCNNLPKGATRRITQRVRPNILGHHSNDRHPVNVIGTTSNNGFSIVRHLRTRESTYSAGLNGHDSGLNNRQLEVNLTNGLGKLTPHESASNGFCRALSHRQQHTTTGVSNTSLYGHTYITGNVRTHVRLLGVNVRYDTRITQDGATQIGITMPTLLNTGQGVRMRHNGNRH